MDAEKIKQKFISNLLYKWIFIFFYVLRYTICIGAEWLVLLSDIVNKLIKTSLMYMYNKCNAILLPLQHFLRTFKVFSEISLYLR